MAGMEHVAKRARVSKATVSRVLNGSTAISAPTRRRVLTACQELNYRLNASIQDLVRKSRGGHTRNLAFVLVGRRFADSAYAPLIDEIAEETSQRQYHLMLARLSGRETGFVELPAILRDERVDGMLVSGELHAGVSRVLAETGIPTVVLGHYADDKLAGLASVASDGSPEITRVIGELARGGRRRFAFVAEGADTASTVLYRRWLVQALTAAGLAHDPALEYYAAHLRDGAFVLMEPVFRRAELPFDAVYAPDRRLAADLSHLLLAHYGLGRPIPVTLITQAPTNFSQTPQRLPVPTAYLDPERQPRTVGFALRVFEDMVAGRDFPRRAVL